jgi:hypothetical protein
LTIAATEFSVIAKICKYKKFHEAHHIILMAMEVHGALRHNMDCFIKECARFFKKEDLKIIYSCFCVFNFSSSVLAIEKKKLCWQAMLVLDLPLLLDLTICI